MVFKYLKVKTKGQNEGEKLLEPKLRFKKFEDNYKKYKLKEIVDFYKGNTLSKSDIAEKGKTPCILYGELYTKYSEIAYKIFSFTNNCYSNLFYSKKNDVLIPCSGETALDISTSTCVLFDNIAIGGDLNVLRPKNQDGKYLSYLLSHKKRIEIAKYAQGDSIVHLYADKIKNINIYLPNYIEQEKVSDFLSLLDKKIELQKRKVDVLKIYKRGLIIKILNSKITLSWDTFKLKDLLNPGSKNRILDTSKYQKINIKLNFNGLCKNTSLKEMADTRPFYIRHTNEIIIGKQNYFNGSIAIVSPDFDGCICSNAIMSFNAKSDNPKYIYYYISQPDYIKRREFLANGTGQKELSENEFLNFTIHIPSLDTQNRIVKILDSIESKIVLENSKLTYLNSLKTSLLQQMFI